MTRDSPLSLFTAAGIELEYMIVDQARLDVLPVSDQLLKAVAGDYVNEHENADIAWSNEVVLHLIELKCNGPSPTLETLPDRFHENIQAINSLLQDMDGLLMPTAMHPWMDPHRETRLWPHGSSEIYDTYNRIFNCQGHGWSNLQSMHINLPFANDMEFARLHSAIRVLMPVMPALAASSPLMEGELTGMMDTRLEMYRHNADLIPEITGLVVPEPACSRDEYQRTILQPMYEAIGPHDPDAILQFEWLNSRGAMAKFDYHAVEIRVLDTQETPLADIAIASLVIAVLKKLVAQDWSDMKGQTAISTESLAALLFEVIRNAELSLIDDHDFLKLFDFPDRRCEVRELWQYLFESVTLDDSTRTADLVGALRSILRDGPLARRVTRALGKSWNRAKLAEIYRVLCQCLQQGKLFEGI